MNFKELKQHFKTERTPKEIKKLLNAADFLTAPAIERQENRQIYLKVGNDKIGKDTIIYNLSSSHNCHSKHGGNCNICGRCYGTRDEGNYKNYFICNLQNEYLTYKLSSSKLIKQVETFYNNLKNKEQIKYIRLHEAGEINPYNYKTALKVAKYFYKNYGVQVYTYTHNNIISSKQAVKNYLNLIDSNKNINYITKPEDHKPGDLYCYCNCDGCSICKNPRILKYLKNTNKKISFIIH